MGLDLSLVWQVFTYDFNVKPCGRETCKKLIVHLTSLYPSIDFGSVETGFLNTDKIKEVVLKELSTKCE